MTAKPRSWWRYIRKHWVATIIIVFVGVIVLIVLGYLFKWDWTGFNSGTSQITITNTSQGNYAATVSQPSKSLWDWLGLLAVLAIPVVVGFGAAWFTHEQQRRDQQIADQRAESERKDIAERAKLELETVLDNQREAALKEYIDKMSELLLHEKLRESAENDEVRIVARARTLHVLRRLDRERKGSVIQFLSESDLLSIVDLSFANLFHASLFKANLKKANLFHANLREADLCQAILERANLSEAKMPVTDLRGANLNSANLSGADICYADLRGADLTKATLDDEETGMKVKLKGTFYNKKPVLLPHALSPEHISFDQTRWPRAFDPEAGEAICVDC